MAHVEKFKAPALAPMLGHYARQKERDGFRRANIDPARTGRNYTLGAPDADALAARVTQLVGMAKVGHEVKSGRAVRKDAVLLCDWVVTQPQDCPDGLREPFFAAVLEFIQERYGGPQNVPGGFVHMDESRPHMHVPVVPVLGGKLQASKLVSRKDLQTFHKGLQAAADAALGRHVSIELTGPQKGSQALSRLSQPDYKAARAELARAQAELEHVRAAVTQEHARLERVRRVRDDFEDGTLERREDAARAAVEGLKPQVRAAEAELARVDDGVEQGRRRVGRMRERLERVRARLEAGRAALAARVTQAREAVEQVRARSAQQPVTRRRSR